MTVQDRGKVPRAGFQFSTGGRVPIGKLSRPPCNVRRISRRDALIQTGGTLAAIAFFQSPLFAWARPGETNVPFLDQPPAPPPPLAGLNQLDWEAQTADSWITPNEKFFRVGHYGVPEIDTAKWKLEIAGLVGNPRSYDLAALKALPKKEVVYTLECSGNHGFPFLPGAIGNARWGGTPLAAVLRKAGRKPAGVEVVFYGADQGEEPLQYIGGLGDKMGEFKARSPFARSMSWAEATDPANLLCYEMNGKPLPPPNGAPLRLIAPRWFGISNVKWLTRIEVIDSRFEGPFQAQRYLTVREVPRGDGSTVWTRTAVGRSLLKSVPAKVTVQDGKYRIYGAAWGTPIARVEVKVDDGPWKPAVIDKGAEHEFAWKFWHVDWPSPAAGEHKITSRAIDKAGKVQPAQDDPSIASKRTYWEANGQITRTIKIA